MEQSSVDSGQWPVDDEETLADSGFFWRGKDGVKVLVCGAVEEAGFDNGFSTRGGGVSAFPENSLNLSGFDDDTEENILENRRRFLDVFEGNFELAVAWQVHGNDVRIVRRHDDIGDSEQRADAVISDLPGVLAAVKTADCVPILLGDPIKKTFAAVHAGWKGTVGSIAKIAVEKLRENYGTKPENLIAAIGPAACGQNYEVGPEVIEQFNSTFERAGEYFTPTRDGHALVDLHAANRDQLIDAGLAADNIYTAPFCTMERTDLFFSYRREKGDFGKTGRLLSVIGRKTT
jgi:YfiH family protein